MSAPDFARQWRPIMTFSSTVMLGNSRMFWNVRAMPRSVTWLGFRPLSLWPASLPGRVSSIAPLVGG